MQWGGVSYLQEKTLRRGYCSTLLALRGVGGCQISRKKWYVTLDWSLMCWNLQVFRWYFIEVGNAVCFQRTFTFSVSVGSTVGVTPLMIQAMERKFSRPRTCVISTACRWHHNGKTMKRWVHVCVLLQNSIHFMRNYVAIIHLKQGWKKSWFFEKIE